MVRLCLGYKNHDCNMCIILVVISVMFLFLNRPSKKMVILCSITLEVCGV